MTTAEKKVSLVIRKKISNENIPCLVLVTTHNDASDTAFMSDITKWQHLGLNKYNLRLASKTSQSAQTVYG